MKLTLQSAIGLIAPLILFSCAQKAEEKIVVVEKPAEISRPDLNSIWGLPFNFTPINQADEKLKELGKATVLVRYIDGGTATGFFISEDGLLITNEHVISNSACVKDRCSGIQLIRDFRVGGDLEVFQKFDLLMASTDLNFALVKVKLPEGRKVPYLKLSKEINESLNLPERFLIAIEGAQIFHKFRGQSIYRDLILLFS
jgi:hypothetical protein